MSGTTVQEFVNRRSRAATALRGIVRRVLLKSLGATGMAQLTGYTGVYGEVEAPSGVEVFQGIGFYAIPAADGKPEAIMLHVGAASGHPVIVAMRAKGTPLPAAMGPADESLMFNSVASIKIDKDGNITLTAKAGATISLGDGTALTALVNGVVVGSGIDPFTGMTYGALGNASAQVLAKK